MRPYRGLTKEGKWVEGWYSEVEGDGRVLSWITEKDTGWEFLVIPETVGQSTGKKENTERKMDIYAGDKISFSTSQTQHFEGIVKWSKKGLCYVVDCYWEKHDRFGNHKGFEMTHQNEGVCVQRLNNNCIGIIIIGNIHDKEKP